MGQNRPRFNRYHFRVLLLIVGAIPLACSLTTEAITSHPTPAATLSATPIRIATWTPTSLPLLTAPLSTETGSPTPIPTQTLTSIPSFTLTPTATILPLSCLPSQDLEQIGLVKWVENGDTIIVDIQGEQYSVHYLGIQAPAYLPEIDYFGPPAATQNAALVNGQVVRLVSDGSDRDEYGRLLRYVVIEGIDTFVNFELLRDGFVRTAPDGTQIACGELFQQAEAYAYQDQLGLWAPTRTNAPTRTPVATRTNPPTLTKPSTLLTPSATTSITTTPSPTTTVISTPTPSPTPSETGSATVSVIPTGTETVASSLTPTTSPEVSPTNATETVNP